MLTALYDGACVVCQSTRATVTALDWRRRVRFIDLRDREAWQAQFPQLRDADILGEIHVLDEGGAVYAGLDATRHMLRELPLGWPLWLLLRMPGTDKTWRSLYRFIARHRYGINRLLGKQVPACASGSCQKPR